MSTFVDSQQLPTRLVEAIVVVIVATAVLRSLDLFAFVEFVAALAAAEPTNLVD